MLDSNNVSKIVKSSCEDFTNAFNKISEALQLLESDIINSNFRTRTKVRLISDIDTFLINLGYSLEVSINELMHVANDIDDYFITSE